MTKKLSRPEVGKLIGVDGMTIYRWEKGEHLPRQRHWAKIEEKTGIAPSTLVNHMKASEPAQ